MASVSAKSYPDLSPQLTHLNLGLLHWYYESNVNWPWRQLWKRFRSPYHVWLSEIMLQQTVIKAVLPKYEAFLETFPTVRDLAAAEETDVKLACSGLGYYRRFGLMRKAACVLVERSKGEIEWPSSYEEWLDLPGVGPYTAAAISSIVLGEARAVVDGNVERVLCRLLDIREPVNSPHLKPVYLDRAAKLLIKKSPGDFNQAVMELGQVLCRVTKPACPKCPLQEGCMSFRVGSQHLAPGAKIRKATKSVELRVVVPKGKTNFGLMDRPLKAKFLKETLGFPTFLKKGRSYSGDGFDCAIDWESGNKVGEFKHSITNHRIKAEVWEMPLLRVEREVGLERVSLKKGPKVLVSSFDKKTLEAAGFH